MRHFIISLTIVCFALSGIILFKALGIPAKPIPEAVIPQKTEPAPPVSKEILEQLLKEQEDNRVILKKLQDTIANLEDQLQKKEIAAQAKVPVEKPKSEIKVLAVLGGRDLASGQVEINRINENLDIISDLARDIIASPNHRVVIEGHTDSRPISQSSPAARYQDNMELSFLRAKAVANLLVKKGISMERISVIGYGDTHPIDTNETVAGRAKNRRVVVKLIPMDREF